MSFWDSISTALRAISANKLRSLLTMLGVVIGIGSVIAMIGIGEGTKVKSLQHIEAMGTNMLMIWPNWQKGHVIGGPTEVPVLQKEDVVQLKRDVPLISLITGSVSGSLFVKYKDNTYFTQVVGGEPQIQTIRNCTNMWSGRWYTTNDERKESRVCVLGWMPYQELFGDANPVGSTIRMQGQNFKVIGVVAYKGGSGNWNPDDQIYIPLRTAMRRVFGKVNYDNIQLQAANSDLMAITQQQVEDSMAKRHLDVNGNPLFHVMNQGDWIQEKTQQSKILAVLMAGIASISLLVGGIGIMNIMLVSVTERTREIGLRKALGAKRRSILSQFLMESVIMCSVGGLIGIAFGLAAVFGIAKLLVVPPIINSTAILLAVMFSVGVGLFFGLYPAIRASSLQPINALRYE